MVEVFKTNVQQVTQATMLLDRLSQQFPLCRINFDLDDCDHILRVEGLGICIEQINHILGENGFWCEVLE